jgi:hypothetical protein
MCPVKPTPGLGISIPAYVYVWSLAIYSIGHQYHHQRTTMIRLVGTKALILKGRAIGSCVSG